MPFGLVISQSSAAWRFRSILDFKDYVSLPVSDKDIRHTTADRSQRLHRCAYLPQCRHDLSVVVVNSRCSPHSFKTSFLTMMICVRITPSMCHLITSSHGIMVFLRRSITS
jgi:hypothetical protein